MRKTAIRLHGILSSIAVLALFMWGLSGLLHPLMSTFGVQQAVFAPPMRPVNLQGVKPMRETLLQAGIEKAAAVRVVVSASENLLQVTESQDVPRRYFRLSSGEELTQHDPVHAVFVAQHYMDLPDEPVRRVVHVSEFSDEYPSVNRLLPVYRVEFDRADGLTAYVYTETNALAAVTDDNKVMLQRFFQGFHTWSWLPRQAEGVRVAVMGLMCASLLSMALTGLIMLVKIRRPQRAPGLRGWHRVAAYVMVVPMFLFSFSGLFHLLQNAWDTPVRNLTLSPPLDVRQAQFAPEKDWKQLTEGMKVNAFSLVQGPTGELLYRLGLAFDPKAALAASAGSPKMISNAKMPGTASEIRNARFDGVTPTGPAVYLRADDGRVWESGDRELALHLGERFTGQGAETVKNMQLVTRFGPGYDFRNKRLPVWQIDYAEPVSATIFVDTTTAVLADKTMDAAKPERFSFSFLHKWNFLFPLGRNVQNAVVSVFVIALLVASAGLGAALEIKRRKRVARQPVA